METFFIKSAGTDYSPPFTDRPGRRILPDTRLGKARGSSLFFLLVFCSIASLLGRCPPCQAQTVVQGVVISQLDGLPLEGVAVVSSRLRTGVITDLHGRYSLPLADEDTVRFSYLGYKNQKFSIHGGWNTYFTVNVSLVILPVNLKNLNIAQLGSFKRDSLQNRLENQFIFSYKPPRIITSIIHKTSFPYGFSGPQQEAGFGFNLESIYFRYFNSHYRRLALYQKTLLQKEKKTFIRNNFNPLVVSQLTGLSGPALEIFMRKYQPRFETLAGKSEYDVKAQIMASFLRDQALRQSSLQMK